MLLYAQGHLALAKKDDGLSRKGYSPQSTEKTQSSSKCPSKNFPKVIDTEGGKENVADFRPLI